MFFRFTTAGESHGKALVAIVEGLPAGMPIDIKAVNHELWRRQQGYGRGGRMKIEKDEVEILSGVRHGNTLGSPVALMIENKDFVHWQEVMSASERSTQKPDREGGLKNNKVVKRPRPGHADLAGGQKFGARDLRNVLERASARETAARVAAGALAKQLLAQFGVEVLSHVVQLGGIPAEPLSKTWDELCGVPDDSPLRCTDGSVQTEMMVAIDLAKEKGDTLGGVYEVVAKNVPVGLGSHTSWNEKLDGRIAQAFMSIHATKAVEIGTGVANVSVPGSQVHDEIFYEQTGDERKETGEKRYGTGDSESALLSPASSLTSRFVRRTNRAGGLEGGITNGEELRVRGYMKPISTLRKPLHSVDIDTKQEDLAAFERSDITAVPAAGVIGEAMLAIVLANSMREKFGGDSLAEMRTNFENYMSELTKY
ncbi:MAG: chorismate synthase [Acidobacteria bacterium]|nr:MAG: chorismate synthase [Acidobacteriota bacterium]